MEQNLLRVHGAVSALKGTGQFIAPSSRGRFSRLSLERTIGTRINYFESLGLDLSRTVWLSQRHENQMHYVDDRHWGYGAYERTSPLRGDAMMTTTRGTVLVIMGADCPVLALQAPGVASVIHAGRSGLEAGLIGRTIRNLEQAYRVHPKELSVFVGPFISAKRYQFCAQKDQKILDWYEAHNAVREYEGRPHINMASIIRSQLIVAGVPSRQVQWDKRCTYECRDLWSHRQAMHKEGNGFNRDNNILSVMCS